MAVNRLQVIPQAKLWWLWAAIALAVGGVIGLLGQAFPALLWLQFEWDKALNASGSVALDGIANFAGELYSPKFALALTLLVAAAIWFFGKSRIDAIAFAVITAFGWLPAEAFKLLINEGRPDQSLLSHTVVAAETDNAFPSGHVCFSIAFGYALWLYFRTSKLKWVALTYWVLSVPLLAWARLYSGVHYATDVLGSLCASTAGLVLIGYLWDKAMAFLERKANEG
jgi:undecaprenyl-diphosphatase